MQVPKFGSHDITSIFLFTCTEILSDGQETDGGVRQVEVRVHLQLGDLVGHVQKGFGIHLGLGGWEGAKMAKDGGRGRSPSVRFD